MKFRTLKAGLSEEEIKQISTKFNSDLTNKWSNFELYSPDSDYDSDAYDALTDIIDWDYLTDEQRDRIDYEDYEKIIGFTEEQFNKNRQLFVEERQLEDKIDDISSDITTMEDLLDACSELKHDYQFESQLFSDKYDLEERLQQLDKRLEEVKAAIQKVTPNLKR